MKKLYIMLCIIIVLSISIIAIYEKQYEVKYINYNGSKLAISIDGKNVDTMPSGKYFLVGYECGGDTKLTWDYETSTLTYNNINANDKCSLKFESSPKLYDLVKIGDYISYTGDSNNGCSANNCAGWNAGQTTIDQYKNYGGCVGGPFKLTTYGWRVLYKSDNSVYIVSAGAPECIAGASTISSLDAAALKYCNELYQSNGECNYETAHPFNDDDFYKFTSSYYGEGNARHLSSSYGSDNCYSKYSNQYCGYNNDIIDNGGYYWFGSEFNSNALLSWNPGSRNVSNSGTSNGLRPVIKLDVSILATGGAGTMEEPYTISERIIENS